MLTIADDKINCLVHSNSSHEYKMCDNDATTCPSPLDPYGFFYFPFRSYEVQTIILYPNQNYDWSSIDKSVLEIKYYNTLSRMVGTTQIFNSTTNDDIPESPIIIQPPVTSNLEGIYLPIAVFCEIEAFKEANAEPSFVVDTPASGGGDDIPASGGDGATLKDKHDIVNVGNATFSFSESSKNKEMIMEYSVYAAYNNSVYLSFFDHECIMAVASGFDYNMTVGAGDPATITAEIDLDLAVLVANGLLWTGSTYSGQLKYCVRADLVSAIDIDANNSTNYIGTTGDSLSFVENKYTLTIEMTQDFGNFTVVAAKEDAGNENEDAETSYGVDACQCNDSQVCEPSTLNQNSLLDICIKLNENATGVVLGAVKSLTLTQGSVTVAAITDTVRNSLTNVSGMDSKEGLVETRLISAFFTDSGGSELTVSGTVVIKFSNARGRQLMNVASEQVRRVQNNEDVAGEGSFDFNVELNAVDEAPSVGSSSVFASIAAIMAMATGFVGLL